MNSKSLVSGHADSGAYTDLNRLSSLKHGDRDSDANVRKVAQEFESLFISEMLKASRKASDVLADDNPMNSETVKQYRDMYDQQLAVSMSREGGGIGLQDVLVRQLSKNKPAPVNTSPFPRIEGHAPALWGSKVAEPMHFSETAGTRNDVAALNSRRLALPGKLTDRLLAGIVPSATTTNTAAVPAREGQQVASAARAFAAPDGTRILGRAVAQPPLAPKKAFTDSDQFVATMLPMAEQAAKRIGIDPVTWWLRPPWRPDGASRSCAMPTAAAAITCSASRPPAAGRVVRRGDHQRVSWRAVRQGDCGVPFL